MSNNVAYVIVDQYGCYWSARLDPVEVWHKRLSEAELYSDCDIAKSVAHAIELDWSTVQTDILTISPV